jgi:hypothetical protein
MWSVEKAYLSGTTREIVIASVATQSPISSIIAGFGDCYVALRLLAMTLLNFSTFSKRPMPCRYISFAYNIKAFSTSPRAGMTKSNKMQKYLVCKTLLNTKEKPDDKQSQNHLK